MVLPSVVVDAVVNKIKENLSPFPTGTMTDEISEDSSGNLIPPFTGVYADFDEPADVSLEGFPHKFPVGIYITCNSSEFETTSKSFNEAFIMGYNVLKLALGDYELQNTDGQVEFIRLKCQELPLIILKKSAKGSVVLAQLKYDIHDLIR